MYLLISAMKWIDLWGDGEGMTKAYDKELREKLLGKNGRKLPELWLTAVREAPFTYAYKLVEPAELAGSVGQLHKRAEWVDFWKQPQVPWRIETANRKPKGLGIQHDYPVRIHFDSAVDVLRYLGEAKDFRVFCQRVEKIKADYPAVLPVCVMVREKILADEHMAEMIYRIAQYFSGTPKTNCYLRELDIPYVDTKFLEDNQKLTAAVFFAVRPELEGKTFDDFCCALSLTKSAPSPNIYVRSLDARKTFAGLREIVVTAQQLAKLDLAFGRVFITENKINGYVFPEVEDGLILFGAGNGILSDLQEIPWLKNQSALWYWGDMDRNGFAILARVRQKYPQVKSFLMAKDIAARYRHFMVADTGNELAMPDRLTGEEQACWQYLTCQPAAANRLEQEKVPSFEVRAALKRLLGQEGGK